MDGGVGLLSEKSPRGIRKFCRKWIYAERRARAVYIYFYVRCAGSEILSMAVEVR